MKRITLLLVGLLTLPFFSYSGGIVTNQNQSAAYIRMFARDASTDIDAVFFNPAGLTKLDDGFYLSLNYQYISQNKIVTSDYQHLNTIPTEYEGEIKVPIFPSVYAAYKTGKFVFSFAWSPIGGGGGATFDNGLPSFEIPVSDLVPTLQAQGQPVSAYSLDAYFEGTSVYWGYQLGASYEVNDMISFYIGGRYVTAKNTYAGHLTDVNITVGGTEMSAAGYFASTATALQPLYEGFTPIYNAADGALRSLSLAEAQAGGYISAAQQAALEGGLATLGVPINTPIGAAYDGVIAPSYLGARRAEYVLADQEDVEVEQTGTGFTPIIGANITPTENLNIGIKYEFKTKIELENNTTTDFIVDYDPVNDVATGMFPDGEKNRADMPAMFSIGAEYKLSNKFKVAAGYHTYFDKNADYGKKIDGVHVDNDEIIHRNLNELALGFEFQASDKLALSLGYLFTQTGVSEEYQTDLSYSNHSNSLGFGGKYEVTPSIDANVGIGYTVYNDMRKVYLATDQLGQTFQTIETYDKDNIFISFSLDFSLWNKKAE